MNVVLTKPWLPRKQRTIVTLPIGSLYVGSYLKRTVPGIDVTICDPDIEEFADEAAFRRYIVSIKPDVVGVTVFSHVVETANRIFSELHRELPATVFVAGGSHVNAVRGRSFDQLIAFNYFIWGEGEIGFSTFCNAVLRDKWETDRIPGLIWRGPDGEVHVQDNTYELNLGRFEPVDYGLIDLKKYFKGSPMGLFHKGRNVAQIITTRGCPFSCTFCASPLNMGRKVRRRPIDAILAELKTLRVGGVDEVHIMDDNFTFNKEHVLAFCQGVRERGVRFHFALPNGVRPDRLDDEMLAAMKEAGFYHMGFGVEVGSNEALKRIKKNLTMEEIEAKIRMVKRHGMSTAGFFIIGFPFETEADIAQTVLIPDRLGLDLASFGNFTPLPGTELFEELVRAGEITSDYLPSFASGKVTYVPRALSAGRIESLQRRMVLRYWLHLRRISFIVRRLHFADLRYVIRRLFHITIRPELTK